MPRKKGTGTLDIDVKLPRMKRLHIRSGTTKKAVRNAMQQMIRHFYQTGKRQLVADIAAGRRDIMATYEDYLVGKIDEIPTGDVLRGAAAVFAEWLEGKEVADKTRA